MQVQRLGFFFVFLAVLSGKPVHAGTAQGCRFVLVAAGSATQRLTAIQMAPIPQAEFLDLITEMKTALPAQEISAPANPDTPVTPEPPVPENGIVTLASYLSEDILGPYRIHRKLFGDLLSPAPEIPRLQQTWRMRSASDIHMLLILLEFETLRAEQPNALETGLTVGLGSLFAPLTGLVWAVQQGMEYFLDSIDLQGWNQDVRAMLLNPEIYRGKVLSLRISTPKVSLTLLARTRKKRLFHKDLWLPEMVLHLDQEAPPAVPEAAPPPPLTLAASGEEKPPVPAQ